MAHMVAMIEVDDAASWEAKFRTHGDLFRSQGIISPYRFAVNEEENQVTLYAEVRDLDTFWQVMESPATAEAMANDGVDRETVKVIVLDKALEL